MKIKDVGGINFGDTTRFNPHGVEVVRETLLKEADDLENRMRKKMLSIGDQGLDCIMALYNRLGDADDMRQRAGEQNIIGLVMGFERENPDKGKIFRVFAEGTYVDFAEDDDVIAE